MHTYPNGLLCFIITHITDTLIKDELMFPSGSAKCTCTQMISCVMSLISVLNHVARHNNHLTKSIYMEHYIMKEELSSYVRILINRMHLHYYAYIKF